MAVQRFTTRFLARSERNVYRLRCAPKAAGYLPIAMVLRAA
jgi:hypothetical protein